MVIRKKQRRIVRPDEEELEDEDEEELEDEDEEDLEDEDEEDLEDEDEQESRVLITKWKKLKLQNAKLKKQLTTLQKNGETAKLKTLIREILNEGEEGGQNSVQKKKRVVKKSVRQKPPVKQTNSRLFRKRQ